MARRMLLILLIPLVGLGGFAAAIIVDRQDAVAQTADTAAAVELTAALGQLMAAVDEEARIAAIVVASGGLVDEAAEVPPALREARAEVDLRRLAGQAALAAATALPGPAIDEVSTALVSVDAVLEHRDDVEAGAITPLQVIDRQAGLSDVLSGALLDGAVVQARRAAAERRIAGDETTGVTEEDVLCALDSAIAGEVVKLRKPQAAGRILDVADGERIVRVDIEERPRPSTHRFMRAA